MKRPKIVVIGGGTGTFTVLSGLKQYPVDLSAIVTMADDGGSTGVLRDELGVLPPGDVRQCLVALSKSPRFLRQLMNYRFTEGGLKGHNFGNLFLSALEKMTGSFDQAVEMAGEILHIEGRVIPATLRPARLAAELSRGRKIRHERDFHNADLAGLKRVYLEPRAKANPKAVAAILEASAVVVGPGDFYSSLIPNFLVSGIPEAMRKTKAVKIYTCNIMTKQGHTSGFSSADYVRAMEQYVKTPFNVVIYNNKQPSPLSLKRYAHEGETFVELGTVLPDRRYVQANLLNKNIFHFPKSDPLAYKRTLIRHDPHKLARIIFGLIW